MPWKNQKRKHLLKHPLQLQNLWQCWLRLRTTFWMQQHRI